MENTESKCLRIYKILCNRPEYQGSLATGEFINLQKFGIRFRVKPSVLESRKHTASFPSPEKRQEFIERTKDGTDLLMGIHFDMTRTEFLPNGYLFWKELEKGAYETIVKQLLQKLETLTAAQ